MSKLFSSSSKLFHSELEKRPKFILDIGANDGGFTRILYPFCERLHAFEPVPDMYEKLVSTCASLPNATPLALALSDIPSVENDMNVFNCWTLLPSKNTSSDSAVDYAGKSGFTVRFETIDRHCAVHGDPDFIKLDVDGYEYRVLLGAVETLKRRKCPIYFEYSYLPRLIGDSIKAMCNVIYALGYKAVSLGGEFECLTPDQMLECLPEHTSFDIMLIPNAS